MQGRGRVIGVCVILLLTAGCAKNEPTTTAGPSSSGTPVANRDQTGGLGKTKSSTGNSRQTKAQNGGSSGGASTTASVPANGEEIRQWASKGSASSNYGASSGDPWNASQATGPPDVDPQCGDNGKAWASRDKNTVDTLTLTYDRAVIPTEIRIFQTYNPSQVSKMEMKGPSGKSQVIYEGAPEKGDGCPVEGYLQNLKVDFPVDTVLITVDQSKLGLGWAEIDAVSLVGTPSV